MDVVLRWAMASDADFLTDMLVAAAFRRPGGPVGSRTEVLRRPDLVRYVSRWPQSGDLAVVAVVAVVDEEIGAAWLRHFTPDDPGYGFVDAATPDLSVGSRVSGAAWPSGAACSRP